MITMLPRMFIAAWNTFVRHEQARHIVPGMAPLYRDLLADHPGAPIFYLSTGAWNTAPTLTRFLKRHGYPLGPLLLTDWGPTNTGWFRSGQDHKRENLHRLAKESVSYTHLDVYKRQSVTSRAICRARRVSVVMPASPSPAADAASAQTDSVSKRR